MTIESSSEPDAFAEFDAVICAYGIMHMPNPEKALAEMRRVLRTGGRIAVSVWQAPAADNGFGLLYHAIQAHGVADVDLPHGPDFFQFGSQERLASALSGTGFAGIAVEPLAQYWVFSEVDEFIACFVDATVRSRGLLAAQNDAARGAIFDAVRSGMQAFRSEDGYRVPMPALIGSGVANGDA